MTATPPAALRHRCFDEDFVLASVLSGMCETRDP
jgi:hypothetical protein